MLNALDGEVGGSSRALMSAVANLKRDFDFAPDHARELQLKIGADRYYINDLWPPSPLAVQSRNSKKRATAVRHLTRVATRRVSSRSSLRF